jgi:hypothetical protein
LSFTGADTDTTRDITRKWRVWLVPDDLNTDFFRMVDSYVKVKLVRHNTGNKKLIVVATRFGPGNDDGEYINIKADLSRASIKEGHTNLENLRNQPQIEGNEEIMV